MIGFAGTVSYALAHLAALGALAAAIGLGGYALERAWLRDRDAPLRALARPVLGVSFWIAALFAVAAIGVLGTPAVVALGLVSALAAARARVLFGASPPGESGSVRFAGVLLLATSPLLLAALSQEVSWDASTYHLTLPKRYLAAGGFVPVPMNVYSHWPLGTELLYAAALALSDHAVAKALHAGFGLATLWAAWLGAKHFHREPSGWLAAPLVLASPVVLFEWSVAYVDLSYAFFFLAGLLFATHWRASGARESVWLAGLCGGALASVKLSGLLGAVAIGAVLLPGLLRDRRGALGHALRFGTPVLLLWLPWLARAALATGNPVYPLAYAVFGGPDWSATLSEQFADWQRSIGMGRGPLDYALLPLRVIVDGGPSYDRFQGVIGLHWLAVVPLAFAGRRHLLVRTSLTASGVYFALWALGSQQMRFLIPILAPLALAGSVGAVELTGHLSGPHARRAIALLGLLAALLAGTAARQPFARALALLPTFAEGPDALREAARQPVHRFVENLPPEAVLLLLDTNQGFFLERPYLADSFFEASQIADWLRDVDGAEAARARLVERGVTHVLRANLSWGIDWPAGLSALLGDPELAPRRYRADDGRFEIFELR
jgi:hypothetical protein